MISRRPIYCLLTTALLPCAVACGSADQDDPTTGDGASIEESNVIIHERENIHRGVPGHEMAPVPATGQGEEAVGAGGDSPTVEQRLTDGPLGELMPLMPASLAELYEAAEVSLDPERGAVVFLISGAVAEGAEITPRLFSGSEPPPVRYTQLDGAVDPKLLGTTEVGIAYVLGAEPGLLGVDVSRQGAPCVPVANSGWIADGPTPIAGVSAAQLRLGGVLRCD